MYLTEKDEQGTKYWVNYDRVNEKGAITPDGDYIYIKNCFIREDFRCLQSMRFLMKKIARTVQGATFAYWKRKKYNERISLYKI